MMTLKSTQKSGEDWWGDFRICQMIHFGAVVLAPQTANLQWSPNLLDVSNSVALLNLKTPSSAGRREKTSCYSQGYSLCVHDWFPNSIQGCYQVMQKHLDFPNDYSPVKKTTIQNSAISPCAHLSCTLKETGPKGTTQHQNTKKRLEDDWGANHPDSNQNQPHWVGTGNGGACGP